MNEHESSTFLEKKALQEALKEKTIFDSVQARNSMYIVLNITSSIGIVLTNKWVFSNEGFSFGTLLTAIHFVFTFLGLVICAKLGIFTPKKIELRKVMPLCLSFCGFVVLTNLSLQYNSVGFYQVIYFYYKDTHSFRLPKS